MADFIPKTDSGLLSFAQPLSTKVSATPTDYGVTAPIATQLASLVSVYAAALSAATDPETRGNKTVFLKDQARVNLVSYLRKVSKQIQGTITVSDSQRQELG